jgi:hypothetical protein
VEHFGSAGQATVDNIIWPISIACWITKAAYTHSEYVIPIAFPLEQRLCERASVLRYTDIVCLLVRGTATKRNVI